MRGERPFWTTRDVAFLREFAGHLTVAELARALGRTAPAVVCYASRHRISLRRPVKSWVPSAPGQREQRSEAVT